MSTNGKTTHPDGKRSHLRALVAAVDEAMGRGDAEALRAAWHELVAALALGPEPALRTCPRCGALAMRDASVCGRCWLDLPAPTPELASGGPAPR